MNETKKINCSIHPIKPAHWQCSHCNLSFCPDCVEKGKSSSYQIKDDNLCPKCSIRLKWLGVANIIEPFWKRLPRIFTYPFSVRPLLLNIILSLLTLYFAGGIVLSFIVWGVLLKYSFSALKATASGDLVPPPVNLETISEDFDQVFKQFGIYFIIGFATFWVSSNLGSFLGFVCMVVAILSIPAMIILLVDSNDLGHAINPVNFISLIFKIGWGYLLMYFFLSILVGAPSVLAGFFVSVLPASMYEFMSAFVLNFYTIVSYHLMGYVILQYHEEIGYEVDQDTFREEERKTGALEESEDSKLLKRVDILIKDGNLDDAIFDLKEAVGYSVAVDIEVYERLFKLLKIQKRLKEIGEYGPRYLDMLIKKNKANEACEVYLECLSSIPGFSISPSELFKMGAWFTKKGKIKEAINSYERILKKDSNHSLAPDAYLRVARIFNDRLKNGSKAKEILNFIIKKYPSSEVIPHARTFLKEIS